MKQFKDFILEARKPGSHEHFMHHGVQAMKHARAAMIYDGKAATTGNRHSKVDYEEKATNLWNKSTDHLNTIHKHYSEKASNNIQDDFDVDHTDEAIEKLVHRTWKNGR